MHRQLGTSKIGSAQGPVTVPLGSDARDRLIGRRDMLVGLWAAELLGLPEERRAIYAMQVMAAGLLEPDPDDLVDKVLHDFTERGVHVSRGEIIVQVAKEHRLLAAISDCA